MSHCCYIHCSLILLLLKVNIDFVYNYCVYIVVIYYHLLDSLNIYCFTSITLLGGTPIREGDREIPWDLPSFLAFSDPFGPFLCPTRSY